MDFIITETQFQNILLEQEKSKISNYLEQLKSFTKKIIENNLESFKINCSDLIKYRFSVGGIMLPISKFLEKNEPNLSKQQISLIIGAVSNLIFSNNKKINSEFEKKIKEENIENEYKRSLSKTKQLSASFENFLKSKKIELNQEKTLFFLIPIIQEIGKKDVPKYMKDLIDLSGVNEKILQKILD